MTRKEKENHRAVLANVFGTKCQNGSMPAHVHAFTCMHAKNRKSSDLVSMCAPGR